MPRLRFGRYYRCRLFLLARLETLTLFWFLFQQLPHKRLEFLLVYFHGTAFAASGLAA